MSKEHPGVRLAPRTVPFPNSVSDEARSNLQRLVGDDGIPLNALHDLPKGDDRKGWKRLQKAVDLQYAEAMNARAQAFRGSVSSIKVQKAIVHVATPDGMQRPNRAYIDMHGGGFIFGGGDASSAGAQVQASLHGVKCFGVDYRMPPEHPFPAALDDCLATYRYVLGRYAPENIIIGGRSAGGNLAAATVLRARDEQLPLPAALVLLSPELDLTESGDSFQTNRMVDVVLPSSLMAANLLYAGEADLTHPYLSPLFGDLAGFPPTFVQSGTRDLFLSNAVRMHRALRRAQVATELHIFEAMPHGGFGATPEDEEIAQEAARFVAGHWHRPEIG